MAATAVTEEESVDVLFHGAGFNLCVTVVDGAAEPTLAIDLEELETGAWLEAIASFPPRWGPAVQSGRPRYMLARAVKPAAVGPVQARHGRASSRPPTWRR